MCGRYAIKTVPEVLRHRFGYVERPNFPPRYNIAPTQPVPVVTAEPDGTRHFQLMRWGFIPAWVRDHKSWPLVINIRSETVEEKPAFRNALKRRRALMPADGFYEWHREGRVSTPYLLRRPDETPFAFAALFETATSPDGSEIDTVALLNTHANGLLSAIHPRAPVIVAASDEALWLDPEASLETLRSVLKPPPDDLLEMIRIGPAVNKVANDTVEVQRPAEAAAPSTKPTERPEGGGSGTSAAKALPDQGSFGF